MILNMNRHTTLKMHSNIWSKCFGN